MVVRSDSHVLRVFTDASFRVLLKQSTLILPSSPFSNIDCVSPRCLKDGSFPFFRWLEKEQRRLVSPLSLCVFILDWGKGELELEEEEEEEEEAEPWLGAASTRRPGALFLSGAGIGSEL